jgi:hypothetical protein
MGRLSKLPRLLQHGRTATPVTLRHPGRPGGGASDWPSPWHMPPSSLEPSRGGAVRPDCQVVSHPFVIRTSVLGEPQKPVLRDKSLIADAAQPLFVSQPGGCRSLQRGSTDGSSLIQPALVLEWRISDRSESLFFSFLHC